MKIFECTVDQNAGTIQYRAHEFADGNPEEWRGLAIYGEFLPDGPLDPITLSLLRNARESADKTDDKAELILIGSGLVPKVRSYFANGADRIFVYDDPDLEEYDPDRFPKVLPHFIDNFKPAAVYFTNKALANHVTEHLKSMLPYLGVTESSDRLLPVPAPDPTRLGEMVICEIP